MNISSYYESDEIVNEYLLFHYGEFTNFLPYPFGPHSALNFHERCVQRLMKHSSQSSKGQALDLGCAVGRASFELARHFDRVLGIDFSVRFIEKAQFLQEQGRLDYSYFTEGNLSEPAIAKIPEGINRKRVQFIHGDACDLPTALGGFKAVLLANLIDRLPAPAACLGKLSH